MTVWNTVLNTIRKLEKKYPEYRFQILEADWPGSIRIEIHPLGTYWFSDTSSISLKRQIESVIRKNSSTDSSGVGKRIEGIIRKTLKSRR